MRGIAVGDSPCLLPCNRALSRPRYRPSHAFAGTRYFWGTW